MDFQSVIAQLKACTTLLTVTELATIFDVHFSTINRWLELLEFPKPVALERMRLFRPDLVIQWTEKQAELVRDTLTIEEVCERIGIYPETYSNWVKQGNAPAARRREIGSGRYLWDAKEIDEWLQKETGGFKRPRPANKPARACKQIERGRRGPKHHEKITAAAH